MVSKEYLDPFLELISEDIESFTTEEVFKSSRYIFTTRKDGEETGYCTHCKSEFKTSKLKHNVEHQCPNCKSKCIVKQVWRGRKTLRDEACFIYYEKSLKDSNVLVGKGFYAERNYSGDYRDVFNRYYLEAVYLFDIKNNKSTMYKRAGWGSERWIETKSIYNFNINSLARFPYFCSYESLKKAVNDTPFKYSMYDKYLEYDMLKFLELYTKHPIIESLTKIGLKGLVNSQLNRDTMYSCLNWRGKDVFKILKINRKDLKVILASEVNITPLFLKLYQISIKDKSNLTTEELKEIERKYANYDFSRLKEILRYSSLRKAFKYLEKQGSLMTKDKYYDITSTWSDYIRECKMLKMDLKLESVLYPKNLYSAHQNTLKQVKIKADKELNEKMAKRVKGVNDLYSFEYKGLIMRAAESTEELINEGKTLHHCVGTYAQSYVQGKTNILFIRKVTEIDKPYFTIEIKDERIYQVRGNRNCNPTKEVEEFIEEFKKEKLKVRKMKKAS